MAQLVNEHYSIHIRFMEVGGSSLYWYVMAHSHFICFTFHMYNMLQFNFFCFLYKNYSRIITNMKFIFVDFLEVISLFIAKCTHITHTPAHTQVCIHIWYIFVQVYSGNIGFAELYTNHTHCVSSTSITAHLLSNYAYILGNNVPILQLVYKTQNVWAWLTFRCMYFWTKYSQFTPYITVTIIAQRSTSIM